MAKENNGTAHVEYTDTFNGEANYSWTDRFSFPIGTKSPLGIIRQAKKLLGLSNVPCRTYDHGDMIELRPAKSCTVAFITFTN